jgi:pyruvyltransferase
MNYVPLFYYLSNNFGDCLSHYLAKKITSKQPVLLNAADDHIKYMITGSILNNKVKNSIAWGVGVAFSTDIINKDSRIVAVRGKKTAELCKRQNIDCPDVFGDPALLLPNFYHRLETKRYKLGIIPHYVDLQIVYDKIGVNDQYLENNGIKIINICDSVTDVIDQINQCENIISSSLHGIVTAVAYEIPSAWVKFSDRIGGDDFKYHDFYSTTNSINTTYIDLRNFNLSMALSLRDYDYPYIYYTENPNDLLKVCPFI